MRTLSNARSIERWPSDEPPNPMPRTSPRLTALIGREIVVPGSIGNLGPGFDTVSLAVSLYLRVRVRNVHADGRGRLVCHFSGAAPLGSNRLVRAYLGADRNVVRHSIEVDVQSDIPQRAGLGSSAAATIAGLKLREAVLRPRRAEDLLAEACEIEGHPDNAAAAYYGGLTTTVATPDRGVLVDRWRWPSQWRLIVATP
jgi:homoserine kinase